MDYIYLKKMQESDIELIVQNIFSHKSWEDILCVNNVNYDQYKELLNKLLKLVNIDLFIFYNNNNAIGYFSITYEITTAIISFSINKMLRGQGYGRKLLSLLEKEIRDNKRNINQISIAVLTNNIALQRKLEDNGYSADNKNDKYIIYKKSIVDQNLIQTQNNVLNSNSRSGVLFLTNNKNSLVLFDWLKYFETKLLIYSLPINDEQIINMNVEYIISYGYSYIIKKNIINIMQERIINLHISLLPWNRGANPNFWSFIDNTPKGVTIHYIDEGLDTGDILFQKEVIFDEKIETFRSTYKYLHEEIVNLFKENWKFLKNKKINAYKVIEKGTYHSIKDFENFTKNNPITWDDIIYNYKRDNITK